MGRVNEPVVIGVVPFFNEERLLSSLLQAMYIQRLRPRTFRLILVDNCSTDKSREVIAGFIRTHEDYPLTVIEEPRKGTGIASATGFEKAMSFGAGIIARTDADCLPGPHWLGAGCGAFCSRSIQLASGPIRPRRDDGYYRQLDAVSWPILTVAGKLIFGALQPGTSVRSAMKYAPGGNTFIRASAYQSVGGYPLSNIGQLDEDVWLSRKIYHDYGVHAMRWCWDAVVYASMRRQRHLSTWQLMDCYVLRPDNERVRTRANRGMIDIR
jgi:glycosyltransferase involved in cell wall biosynthesis